MQLPVDDSTSKEWVTRWLRTQSLPALRTVGKLLQRHDLMSIDVCANILATAIRDCRGSELLTEADVEATVTPHAQDTRYTLLLHTLLHRVAAIIERAADFRSHIMQMLDPELIVLAHFSHSLIAGGVFDTDMGLGTPDLFILLCAQAWRHLENNSSEQYWESVLRVTMAAGDSALRQIRSEQDVHGYAVISLPIANIVMMLGRPEGTPGVSTAIEVCNSGVFSIIADFAWQFCNPDDLHRASALVLRGGIPLNRYRRRSVRTVVFAGLERVNSKWAQAFARPEAVERVALQMLLDVTVDAPDKAPSLRMLRCALRLLGFVGMYHPDRAVFEPVFWTLSNLIGLLPRYERETVGGACTRGNHALLREMLPHCSPDQQRWWRQLCGFPAGPTDAVPAAGVDSLTDMPCRRLYRFHDDTNSLPVSLETITRHLITADPLLDPHTRVPVSRETVVEIGEKIEGCVEG
jgi:hypothetical protein